jgi:hypothetical protein
MAFTSDLKGILKRRSKENAHLKFNAWMQFFTNELQLLGKKITFDNQCKQFPKEQSYFAILV